MLALQAARLGDNQVTKVGGRKENNMQVAKHILSANMPECPQYSGICMRYV